MTPNPEQRILICAPFGKDAALACAVLEHAGLSCCVCKDFAALMQELDKGAGALLVVEELLTTVDSTPLGHFIASQPGWSDLPVLVLMKSGLSSPWIPHAYDRLGNPTLLERPVRASTLISAARSALRARARQFEIRKADNSKDEFLAMLGHELRNPLAPIGAAAQLLDIVATDPERVRYASRIIARQVGHMTSLIDDLLDVARVTRGLITLDHESLDLRYILSEAVEQVNPSLRAKKHQLALHLPPEPATVLGDRKRLIQVVTNILSNASKYTPDGGSIVARLQVKAGEVILAISDDGIGMTSAVVARVFELFAQAERTPDRSQGGLGLGLSLVRSLVESHGGSVSATSDGLGKGSVFTIRLPFAASLPVMSEIPAGLQSENLFVTPMSILVVDDNVDAADSMHMMLTAVGHEVSVCYTAASALEQARKAMPQVFLLDIGLPDMDGAELARQLRRLPSSPESVLIAVTGYGQEKDKKKSAEAGFDHHLVKPVQVSDVLTILAGSRF
jgi:signal transduction histidine kinase